MHVPDPPRGRPLELRERVVAWRPRVPDVAEVLHARFVAHAYPAHTHDTWTLLVVEHGAVRFDLDRPEHGALPGRVTLLPPHVAHTGRAGTDDGFVKRVVYLDTTVLDGALAGRAATQPGLADPALRRRVGELHASLLHAGDELEAEGRLALVADRLRRHLGSAIAVPPPRGVAHDLRDLLDERLHEGLTLREAGALIGAHPDALVRTFTAAFGLPPHRYLTGRRLDAARARLLAGEAVAGVAVAVGFHDQAHLTRHFKRLLGATPAAYARSARDA